MKILVAGASGLVGSALIPALESDGAEITRLARSSPKANEIEWHPNHGQIDVARLEGLLPPDPKTTLIADVKRLGPPTDPAVATNPPPSDPAPVAKVLNPSEATKREDVEEELLQVGHVRVVWIEGVPEGQVVIAGDVDGVEDWDVVRQVLVSERRNASQDS